MKSMIVSMAVLGLVSSLAGAATINDDFENYLLGDLEPQSIYTNNTGAPPFADVVVTNGSQAMRQWDSDGTKNFSTKTVGNVLEDMAGDVLFAFDVRIDADALNIYLWGDTGRPVQMFLHTNTNIGFYGDAGWAYDRGVFATGTWYRMAIVTHFDEFGLTTYDYSLTRHSDGVVVADEYGVDSSGAPTVARDIQFNSSGVVYIDNLYVGAVPEPATLALLGLGGLFLRRRR